MTKPAGGRGNTQRAGWGTTRRLPSGRWQARFQEPDRQVRSAAPETFATKGEAVRWLAHRRSDLDRGVFADDVSASRPVSAWWPAYRAGVGARLRPTTLALYDTAWTVRIEPEFGDTRVARLKPSAIDAWVAEMIAAGLSPSKVRETYGVLRRLLACAVRDGAISHNPCDQRARSMPRSVPVEHPVLTPDEVETFAQFFTRRERDRVLVLLLAYGGLRIGEALALRASDLRLDTDQLLVRRSWSPTNGETTTKTHAARCITLPHTLVQEIRAISESQLPGGDVLLFGGRGGKHRSYHSFRRDAWDPALQLWNLQRQAAGQPALSITPHDLRAVCASLLVDAGASIKDVQAHLGHADVTTTMTLYARVHPDRHIDLAQRADGMILASRLRTRPT